MSKIERYTRTTHRDQNIRSLALLCLGSLAVLVGYVVYLYLK